MLNARGDTWMLSLVPTNMFLSEVSYMSSALRLSAGRTFLGIVCCAMQLTLSCIRH
jgi:hypothetical protein